MERQSIPGSPFQSRDLTQGLDRVSLLEVAALQGSHVLEGVPHHQLQLVQTVLLESDVKRPPTRASLRVNAGSHLVSRLHGLELHQTVAGGQTLEGSRKVSDRLHQPAVQVKLHPARPLLLHPLQVEQQSVRLAVCQHQVVEGHRAHPLVATQVA